MSDSSYKLVNIPQILSSGTYSLRAQKYHGSLISYTYPKFEVDLTLKFERDGDKDKIIGVNVSVYCTTKDISSINVLALEVQLRDHIENYYKIS